MRALEPAGDELASIDRIGPPLAQSGRTESITSDLFKLNSREISELLAGYNVVYHLAWSTNPASAEASPLTDLEENLAFMLRLLEVLQKQPARLVFVSSGGTVYGDGGGMPLSEDTPLKPRGVYGATKAAAEAYASAFRMAHSLDVRVARLANPYGAGQSRHGSQGVLSRFIQNAVSRTPLEVWGDGTIVRDYIHVSDAVAAISALGEVSPDVLGKNFIYNVGSGGGTSIRDILEVVQSSIDRPLDVVWADGRGFDIPVNRLSIDRISNTLGWRPALGLEQGVRKTVRELQEDPARLYSSQP